MIKDIIKIKKEGKNFLIFSSKGMLLCLNEYEYKILKKYGKDEKINNPHRDFLERLSSYQILEFKDSSFLSKSKLYDTSLLNHNSDKPLYPAPVLAHLSITDACNMSCKYCSVREMHGKISSKNLTTSQWKKIISDLASWGVFQIGFTGGEPTLRKDLVELAQHVTNQGCVFNLTTNGWNLNKNLIKKLVEAGMRQCQVSLDSHIEEIHNELRGKYSYQRVLKSIKFMQEEGVAVGIDCVVSKKNINTMLEFINWIKEKNIPYLTLIKLKKGSLPLENYLSLVFDYQEYSQLLKQICKRAENQNPNITLDCGGVSNLQGVAEKKVFLNFPVAGCPVGHHLICVAPNGDIFPCAALLEKEFCLGNFFHGDIKAIWRDNVFLKQMRLIKQNIRGKCKSCERIDICRGGCRGITYSIKKNILDADPTCKFQEVQNGNKS